MFFKNNYSDLDFPNPVQDSINYIPPELSIDHQRRDSNVCTFICLEKKRKLFFI